MTISIYNCERIAIDDKFASSEEIPIAVYLETKDLDSIRKSKFFVKLKIAEDASMGQIEMVENELKKAHIFNVKYYTVENLVCDY